MKTIHLMKKSLLPLLLLCVHQLVSGQVTGTWKTVGDRDGTEKSIVEIYESNGKLYGKVIRLMPTAGHTTCEKCPGDLKDKPIVGMVILKDFIKTTNGGK